MCNCLHVHCRTWCCGTRCWPVWELHTCFAQAMSCQIVCRKLTCVSFLSTWYFATNGTVAGLTVFCESTCCEVGVFRKKHVNNYSLMLLIHKTICCLWLNLSCLPARRYARTGLCESNVSVCPSVTRRYCVKTKKASVMISSLPGSPTILVFWCEISSW